MRYACSQSAFFSCLLQHPHSANQRQIHIMAFWHDPLPTCKKSQLLYDILGDSITQMLGLLINISHKHKVFLLGTEYKAFLNFFSVKYTELLSELSLFLCEFCFSSARSCLPLHTSLSDPAALCLEPEKAV